MIVDGFIRRFNSVCRRYGLPVQRIRLQEDGVDERGHPVVSEESVDTRGLFHVNTGSERLILGHNIHDYDAYILVPHTLDVVEGDEFLVNGERYKVKSLIRNRSHIECNLKRVKG